ncbi:MAG: hypothetical protein KKB50_11495 [Planctomycetes bacterium]|nr:hypothetical protein [Planctomycetota bacterium]
MNTMNPDLQAIPEARRVAFGGFARTLMELARDNLLGLSAFGGWLAQDPLYEHAPARSVAVLARVDLEMLERLAAEGRQFGKQGISAPLIMTPEYLRASCDVFPLELLEVQQLHALVCGEDHFADLTFAPHDVRLQCERELKSGLIQLRQGLLAAAGRHKLLPELCLACAERGVRILRGVLYSKREAGRDLPRMSTSVVAAAAELAELELQTLRDVVATGSGLDFAGFQRFYAEVEALAGYVDGLDA